MKNFPGERSSLLSFSGSTKQLFQLLHVKKKKAQVFRVRICCLTDPGEAFFSLLSLGLRLFPVNSGCPLLNFSFLLTYLEVFFTKAPLSIATFICRKRKKKIKNLHRVHHCYQNCSFCICCLTV